MDDPVVTFGDLRDARVAYGGFCVNGMKVWGEAHGLTLNDVYEGRVRLSQLEATGDALALRVARVVRRRVGL